MVIGDGKRAASWSGGEHERDSKRYSKLPNFAGLFAKLQDNLRGSSSARDEPLGSPLGNTHLMVDLRPEYRVGNRRKPLPKSKTCAIAQLAAGDKRGTAASRMSTMAKHETTRCAKVVWQKHFPFVQNFEVLVISRGLVGDGPGKGQERVNCYVIGQNSEPTKPTYIDGCLCFSSHLLHTNNTTRFAQNLSCTNQHHTDLPIHTTQTSCLSSSQESRPTARATRPRSG